VQRLGGLEEEGEGAFLGRRGFKRGRDGERRSNMQMEEELELHRELGENLGSISGAIIDDAYVSLTSISTLPFPPLALACNPLTSREGPFFLLPLLSRPLVGYLITYEGSSLFATRAKGARAIVL